LGFESDSVFGSQAGERWGGGAVAAVVVAAQCAAGILKEIGQSQGDGAGRAGG
jgi:hypothetical protein